LSMETGALKVVTDINELDLNGTYTYADYLTWRFDEYVELFRGRLKRMSPAPKRRHQDIAGNIFSELKSFLRRQPCKVYIAPFDVRLPKPGTSEIYTVVQPDICIICDNAKLDEQGCVGAPDTIIEVLSRGNIDRDINEKFSLYEESGVQEYWIVSPGEKTVTCYLLDENNRYKLSGEYADPGPIPVASLPGYAMQWETIFED
jgi:Uma2 family endonuclease